jgi:hypothetical protein
MRRVFGPRTAVEAAFIVAVPVIAAALGARTWTIIAASAVAYLIIVVLEATLGRREGASAPGRSRMRIPSRTALVKRQNAQSSPEPEVAPVAGGDGVLDPAVALPAAEPVAAAELPGRPEPAPVPVPAAAAPSAAPEPSFTATTSSEHVRVLRPEPIPEPVAERPQLTAVPELEPEPVAVAAAPEPVPEPSTVVPIGVGAGPRQWNLWDLERLTREHTGGDIAQDEERQFLLMYLREFADSAGLLPLDFDGLVRDSFGELVGTR